MFFTPHMVIKATPIFDAAFKNLPHGIQAASGFALESALVRLCTAYYVISVRRFENLPTGVLPLPHPASFRFEVTLDTLASG